MPDAAPSSSAERQRRPAQDLAAIAPQLRIFEQVRHALSNRYEDLRDQRPNGEAGADNEKFSANVNDNNEQDKYAVDERADAV